MRNHVPWTVQVETDLQKPRLRQSIQWTNVIGPDRQTKLLRVSKNAVWRGDYDALLAQFAWRWGRLQYDEKACVRDVLARSIHKYAPERAGIEAYVKVMFRRKRRELKSDHHYSMIKYPCHMHQKCMPIGFRLDRIMEDLEQKQGQGQKAARMLMNEIDDTQSARSQEEILFQKEIGKAIYRAINRLPQKERSVVKKRLCMMVDGRKNTEGSAPESFKQMGKKMGLSTQRVQQIHSRAIEKLRRSLEHIWIDYTTA